MAIDSTSDGITPIQISSGSDYSARRSLQNFGKKSELGGSDFTYHKIFFVFEILSFACKVLYNKGFSPQVSDFNYLSSFRRYGSS